MLPLAVQLEVGVLSRNFVVLVGGTARHFRLLYPAYSSAPAARAHRVGLGRSFGEAAQLRGTGRDWDFRSWQQLARWEPRLARAAVVAASLEPRSGLGRGCGGREAGPDPQAPTHFPACCHPSLPYPIQPGASFGSCPPGPLPGSLTVEMDR